MNLITDASKFKGYLDKHVRPGTRDLYIQAIEYWAAYVQNRYFASSPDRNASNLNRNASNLNRNANIKALSGLLSHKTAQAYLDMLAKTGKSSSTIATRGHAIMRYLKWKGEDKKLDIPTIRMKTPEYLTIDQINKVAELCNTPLERMLFYVLFDSAVRISELLNVEIKDIDFKQCLMKVVRKGGREDEVNISAKAVKSIELWLKTRQYKSKKLFDIDYHTAWKMIKTIGKRAGIDLHPHTLRHSRARHMLTMGVTPHIVQQHLGHRSIATTLNIYGSFTASQIKEQIPEW